MCGHYDAKKNVSLFVKRAAEFRTDYLKLVDIAMSIVWPLWKELRSISLYRFHQIFIIKWFLMHFNFLSKSLGRPYLCRYTKSTFHPNIKKDHFHTTDYKVFSSSFNSSRTYLSNCFWLLIMLLVVIWKFAENSLRYQELFLWDFTNLQSMIDSFGRTLSWFSQLKSLSLQFF